MEKESYPRYFSWFGPGKKFPKRVVRLILETDDLHYNRTLEKRRENNRIGRDEKSCGSRWHRWRRNDPQESSIRKTDVA